MDVAVVGAGPTGLVSAVGLARRGHRVALVDNDPGPASEERWERRGVMQFHHPHAFRPQAVAVLSGEVPDAVRAMVARGAEPIDRTGTVATTGGVVPAGAGLRSRRMVVERELRRVAEREPGVTTVLGRADAVLADRGRARGVRVGDRRLDADLVLLATGRAGHLADDLRAPGESADCGVAYVSRQYRLRPGAAFPPMGFPVLEFAGHDGYAAVVFPHDDGVFSALIARPVTDARLTALRHEAAWEAAARAVPLLATWTDPGRAVPVTPVLPGGRLHNTYRGQLDPDGRVPLPGLVFLGDAVCTTNPTAGRGIATSLMQVERLLALLDEHPADAADAVLALDAWCTERIRPWYEDHLAVDAAQLDRWAGVDVDPARPPTSDLVAAAAQVDPSLMPVVGPYLDMSALPATLTAVHPRVQEIYASGWRPGFVRGPTVDELAELVAASSGPAATAFA
ncbi:FAD-dependent oxidoreductase [Actinomycetospora chlora]